MKEYIKTLIRLSAPLGVAIVPFMLMRAPDPSCSMISGVTICASSSYSPGIWIQAGVSLAASLAIITAYYIWKSQIKSVKKSGNKLWFVGFHLITTVTAATASILVYESIKNYHSQESAKYALTLSSEGQPYFGYGLNSAVFYILIALYMAPILISLQKFPVRKGLGSSLKKITPFK